VAVFSRGGFKKLLKKFTSNNFSSLLTGIISTVIVQSSNLISVLVLAFVGTGILSLSGGLAVMLGSNIGTTIPEALLGSIGLNYDIKIFTFPIIFLGAVGITFFSRYDKLVMISKALIGLALIFLSFAYMKSGLLFITEWVDLSHFMNMSPWVFLSIGLLLTVLVQSGGAVFVVALTSVSSGLITPEAALPIILGSYLGATITIVMGSLGNQPAIKKQVAAGHVGFNLLVVLLGMLFLHMITVFFMQVLFPTFGVITGLSAFYVGFRTLVALMVFPFVGVFSRLVQRYITDKKDNFTLAIQRIPPSPLDTEVAILAIKQDVLVYFKQVISYNLNVWDFYLTDITQEQSDIEYLTQRGANFEKTYLKQEYGASKYLQEKLLTFLA
jgi:phosphate:Na+ symporter